MIVSSNPNNMMKNLFPDDRPTTSPNFVSQFHFSKDNIVLLNQDGLI